MLSRSQLLIPSRPDGAAQPLRTFSRWLAGPLAAAILGLGATAKAAPIVFASAAGDAAGIQATVDAFRFQLGNPNNGNAAGPLATGRREINWDGGGATGAAPAPTPFTGFQNIRGNTTTTPGTGFLQTPVNAPELLGINPTYGTTFAAFSPLRIFTPLGSNVVDATFSVPGTGGAVPAAVRGFGAVFSDVDLANTTSLQFFGTAGQSLGTFFAPAFAGNQTFSFLGVFFDAGEEVARVRLVNGNAALGPTDGGGIDVVVMDDFFFSEPVAVPEPAALTLLGVGLLSLALLRRRRPA
jgi:hypothetical protein